MDGLITQAAMMNGGGFNPRTLSPFLWLSDNGSDASVWHDISGEANHATQSLSAYRPAIISSAHNGRQCRRFDGSNDNLRGSFDSVSAMSVLAVVKVTSTINNYERIFTQRGSGDTADYTQSGHYIPILLNDGGYLCSYASASVISYVSAPIGDLILFLSTHTGSSVQNYINGTSLGGYASTLGSNGTEYSLGTTIYGSDVTMSPFNGDLCEVFAFPSVADETTRNTLLAHFASKWGVTL